VLHGGTVIGADGYGYVSDGQRHVKIPQTGRVVIEDDVEIGANCSVDRATFGTTLIRKGVKLDNQVHIGHNCIIGENTLIVAQVGIAGSVEIGKNCTLAGHSGVLDQLKVGDQVTITTRSIVTKDVPSHSTVSGHPAMDHRQWMKLEALIRRLPDFYEESKASRRHKAGSGREKPKRKKTGR
jgi:UDP-3-O-[3-hydroxymyristoyl] glucosamine N-acyltransferase